MEGMDDCVFCKIVRKEIPSYDIWEDEKHVAFLTRWPNTDGFAVVITKEHYPSYAFELPDRVLSELTLAAKKVGKKIDAAFEDVGRTGMIFEGFGVNHVHAKLFPMHGTATDAWKQHTSIEKKFFKLYEGYISSHDAEEASPEKLQHIAEKIRSA